MTRMRQMSNILGLRRSIIGMPGMVILVGLGEKMAERFLPIYLLALGGAFLWQVSPETNFLTAVGCGLIGTIWFILRGHDLSKAADS